MAWLILFTRGPGFLSRIFLALFVMAPTASSLADNLLSSRYAPELHRLVPFARSHLERLSVAHQNDLLRALKDPELIKDLTRAQVDLDGLRAGIADSDAGKMKSFFEMTLLNPGSFSNEFCDFLKGLAPKTKAGKALGELLDLAGFSEKALLNRELSNADIRWVLAKHPLLQSFLHELPGMMDAMNDVNTGRISPEQFKKRMGANLFHNDGPGFQFPRGFWQNEMTGKLVTQLVSSHLDPRVRSFFEFTVFSGTIQGDAVLPRYNTPVTVEGVFHAMLDRVSQGSRGGIIKIFFQNGGHLKDAANVLQSVPQGTVAQLEAFEEALGASIYLTRDQKSAARNSIQQFLVRLRRQNEFLKNSVRIHLVENEVQSLTLHYRTSSGFEVNQTLDSSHQDHLEKALEDLLQAEEDLHGDPLLLSGKRPAAQGC